MSHTCRSLVLHCMDFRFAKDLKKFMEDHGLLGDADEVAFAGAAKNFLDEESKVFAMRQIELANRLHHVREVHLMNHTDCGAYGGQSAFGTSEDERDAHLRDLHAAAQSITQTHPDIQVHCWLAHINELSSPPDITFEWIEDVRAAS